MKKRVLFNKKLYTALRTLESEYHDLICMEDEETIHDLRVAIRRVTPLLDLYINGQNRKVSKKKLIHVNKRFKNYFKALSAVRDQQVLIPKIVEMHPSSLSVLSKMDMDLRTLHRNILIQASEWEIPELIDVVMLLLIERPMDKIYVRSQVASTLKERRKVLKSILTKGLKDANDLHKLRIALKKYRYVIEMAESLEIQYKISSQSIKKYQDKLGTFQDITILIGYLKEREPHLPLLDEIINEHDKICLQLINESLSWKKELKI